MGVNKVAIWNRALGRISGGTVVTEHEQSMAARYCRLFFDEIVSNMLEGPQEWSFAKRRVTLAQTTCDRPEWAYAYLVPSDMASASRVIPDLTDALSWAIPYTGCEAEWTTFLDEVSVPYNIEGGLIYCSEPNAILEYVINDLTHATITAMAERAITVELGSLLAASPVKKDKSLANALAQEAELMWSRAIADDRNRYPEKWGDYVSETILARQDVCMSHHRKTTTTSTPVSVTPTPTPTTALQELAISPSSVAENAVTGTFVGTFQNRTSGSTLSIVDNAGGRFDVAGGNLVTGSVTTDYETATFHIITVLETLGLLSKLSTLTINVTNVFEQPALGPLSLSSTAFAQGTSASGTIIGATAGSTITASGLPAGLRINGPLRTFFWDGLGAVGSGTITLLEALADSPNTPQSSPISYSISGSLRAGTLTQTSTAGTNPPTWDSLFPDGQDGDTVELYWTTNGSTPTASGTPQGSRSSTAVTRRSMGLIRMADLHCREPRSNGPSATAAWFAARWSGRRVQRPVGHDGGS
jgi:hypothetical protein